MPTEKLGITTYVAFLNSYSSFQNYRGVRFVEQYRATNYSGLRAFNWLFLSQMQEGNIHIVWPMHICMKHQQTPSKTQPKLIWSEVAYAMLLTLTSTKAHQWLLVHTAWHTPLGDLAQFAYTSLYSQSSISPLLTFPTFDRTFHVIESSGWVPPCPRASARQPKLYI